MLPDIKMDINNPEIMPNTRIFFFILYLFLDIRMDRVQSKGRISKYEIPAENAKSYER